MDPNLISSSYLSPFKKTFSLSKPANYFTKIISLHYINSLLHISKLLAQHRDNPKQIIELDDINLATTLLKDPIHKAEYNINKKKFFLQNGGGHKKVIIRKNKKIVEKVLNVENKQVYQKTKNYIENEKTYKPYQKVFIEFKKQTGLRISNQAKNKIASLSNELINQLLTMSYQKSQLIPNNHIINKNDILYTLLEV